jgi:hypothetical protein
MRGKVTAIMKSPRRYAAFLARDLMMISRRVTPRASNASPAATTRTAWTGSAADASEIGLRRALGTTNGHIRTQFLAVSGSRPMTTAFPGGRPPC